MKTHKLEGIHISGIVLSDLFFNYPHPATTTIEEDAADFASTLGQGGDLELIAALVEDYKERL